jgi:hypothetical protein
MLKTVSSYNTSGENQDDRKHVQIWSQLIESTNRSLSSNLHLIPLSAHDNSSLGACSNSGR